MKYIYVNRLYRWYVDTYFQVYISFDIKKNNFIFLLKNWNHECVIGNDLIMFES